RRARPIAFFALDRPGPGSVPVYSDGGRLWVGEGKGAPLFHALPAETKQPPTMAVPLYEFVHEDGKQRAYVTDAAWSKPGYRRTKGALCLGWRNPLRVTFPPR